MYYDGERWLKAVPSLKEFNELLLLSENIDRLVKEYTAKVEDYHNQNVENNKAIRRDLDSLFASTTSYSYLSSTKSDQLIVNGKCETAGNENFNDFKITFEHPAVLENYSNPVFYTDKPYSRMISSLPIFVNPESEYIFSFRHFTKSVRSSSLVYLTQYDMDGLEITQREVGYVDGTQSKIVNRLNPGDTYIYVDDLRKIRDGYSEHYKKNTCISIWSYTSSQGHKYGPYTYTRNTIKDNIESFDVINNRIKLASPYSGNSIPVGTDISLNAYEEPYGNYIVTDDYNKWKKYRMIISDVNDSGKIFHEKRTPYTIVNNEVEFEDEQIDSFKFFPGVYFCKLSVTSNMAEEHNSKSSYFADISMRENIISKEEYELLRRDLSRIKKDIDDLLELLNKLNSKISLYENRIQKIGKSMLAKTEWKELSETDKNKYDSSFSAKIVLPANIVLNSKSSCDINFNPVFEKEVVKASVKRYTQLENASKTVELFADKIPEDNLEYEAIIFSGAE